MTKTEALDALQSGAMVQTWSGAVGKVVGITDYTNRVGYTFTVRLQDTETRNDMGAWVPDAVSLYPRPGRKQS